MNKSNGRTTLSTMRSSRNRSAYNNNIHENDQLSEKLADGSPRYRRNYVRFRKSLSRSRSRDKPKSFLSHPSIDYRKKLILLALQTISLLHLCSVIYCHQRQPLLAANYTLITLLFFNLLAYSCVQYDTQQAEHGGLLLGESPLLFLLWYGGILGGGLALLIEKHKHLRSRAFTNRLRLIMLFNVTWLFLIYIFHMYRNVMPFIENSSMVLSPLEAQHPS